jgi:colanic acid/amylovoran biosynthesis glycosyltransferase
MHICVLPHIFPARSETFVVEHVCGLARRGHRVTVIARNIDSAMGLDEVAAIDRLGIRRVYVGTPWNRFNEWARTVATISRRPSLAGSLLRVHSDLRRRLLNTVAAAEAVRDCKPDLVHFHFGDHAARLQGLRASLPKLPPMLVTWHGYDANAVPQARGPQVYADLFRTAALHSVGSGFMRRRLTDLGARAETVHQVPMGIDPRRFTMPTRERGVDAPLRLLSVGRLEEVKGHAYLIAAVELLANRGVTVSLRIAGGGRLRSDLENQISAAGLTGSVTLLGAIPSDQVAEEMQEADLFALTGVPEANGKIESQGLVYAEAQATGLPVIGSRVGGVPEALLDGQTGTLCEPRDVPAIARAIERFVQDRAELQRFGQRARQFVEGQFSLDLMLDRFEALYTRMV